MDEMFLKNILTKLLFLVLYGMLVIIYFGPPIWYLYKFSHETSLSAEYLFTGLAIQLFLCLGYPYFAKILHSIVQLLDFGCYERKQTTQ